MTLTPDIDLTAVRCHHGSQNIGFEEMTRQLVLAESLPHVREIEHRGPGADGGVEVLVHFTDGTSAGWQTKFFPAGFGKTQLGQVKESFESALEHYGAPDKGGLKRWVVVVPINLSGPGTTEKDDARKRWNSFKTWADKTATAAGLSVEIELWDGSQLIKQLTNLTPPYPSIRAYWFNQTVMTDDWFRQRLNAAIAALDERYHPEDHVPVESLAVFDVLCRDEKVIADLRRDFKEARDAYPIPVLLAGEKYPPAPAEELFSANQSLEAFIALEAYLEKTIEEEWPSAQWAQSWETTSQCLRNLEYKYREFLPREDQSWESEAMQRLHKKLWLPATTREVFGSPWHRLLPADSSRLCLFVGAAGSGKSHLLAKATEDWLTSVGPAILLLGQQFSDSHPTQSLLNQLDLASESFDLFLGTLNAAALARNSRALIVIDALNEGHGYRLWQNHLQAFADAVHKHPRLVLVLSCRQEYLDVTVPRSVQEQAVRIDVTGFSAGPELEAAMRVYMDNRGIQRPSQPWQHPEFRNPLFLRLVCDALTAAGKHQLPSGLHGAGQLFAFVLDTRGRYLQAGRDGSNDLVEPLRTALSQLATNMAQQRRDYVPLGEASQIIDKAFAPYPPPEGKSWLDVLKGNGFLRIDSAPTEDASAFAPPESWVRFSYQQLSDYLIATSLLKTAPDIQTAFAETGPLAFLLKRKKHQENGRSGILVQIQSGWKGVMTALWVGIAEQHELEFTELACFTSNQDEKVWFGGFHDCLIESLRWRSPGAFTDTTRDLTLHWLKDEYLGLRLEMAPIPGHPWNADSLDAKLLSFSRPQRDKAWSCLFLEPQYASLPAAENIIQWAATANLAPADDEVLRLVATLLTWFLTLSNRKIRDTATKGLMAVLHARPALIKPLFQRFLRIDDDYVRERLLASAYGALLHLRNAPSELSSAATQAYDAVFNTSPVTRHLMVRHYARRLIELAAARNSLPAACDLAKCRPPYNSDPITFWPSKEELSPLNQGEAQRAIIWSCGDNAGYMGDFGNYSMSGIHIHFSAKLRGARRPQKREMFDDGKARRWVAHRAITLGDAELWADPNAKLGTSRDRNTHTIERIGKKYQWIALNELLGTLSDHHWCREDYCCPWDISDDPASLYYLDIDPSVLGFDPKDADGLPRIGFPETDYQADNIASALAWVNSQDDLPDLAQFVETTQDGQRWWASKTFRMDKGYLDKLNGSKVMQTGQAGAWLIFVRRNQISGLVASLKGMNPADTALFPHEEWNTRHVGEVSYDAGTTDALAMTPLTLPLRHGNVRFCKTMQQLHPHKDEYDESHKIPALFAPSQALVARLQLRPEGPRSAHFVTPDGQLAFVDPNAYGVKASPVFNSDLLAPLLEAEGLIPVWLLWGEKDGGIGFGPDSAHYNRRAYGGVFWQKNGEWQSETWLVDEK